MKNPVPLIARILISAIFLMSGWGKIINPAGTQQYMAAHGMPFAGLFLIGAMILAILGGLLMVSYFGPGPISFDARTTSSRSRV